MKLKTVKTRNSVKNIKVLDKGVNLSKRMKDAYVRTKERAEETQSPSHATPAEYASDNIQGKVQDAARETVYHSPNPRQKAQENWNRAKGHFEDVKRNMPGERKRAAEQAQKAAVKTKTEAENLRKTADNAGETATKAKTAVKDAKQHFKEVRQQGRQKLREVKQKTRMEQGGRAVKTKELAAKTPTGELRPAARAESTAINRPNYLSRGVQAPKSTDDIAKTLQTSAKSGGKAIKSYQNGRAIGKSGGKDSEAGR